MTRFAAALLLVAAVAACSADAAAPTPVVRLAGLPETLVVGERWVARLTVRPAARPILRASSGARTVNVRARSTSLGRYTATLRLPTAGIWRLAALVRGRSFPLGRIRVLASYPLALPAQILALDDRTLLVVERQGRDQILRVDVGTGRFSVVTTRIPSPWGLARDANGRVLVSGGSGVYELGGRKISDVAASPIAAAPGGVIYFAELTRVGRIGRGGGVETLSTDVAAPHAIVLRRDGSLVVSDSGNGRLLRIDPATRATTVVASGLKNPLGAVEATDGDLLVVEFDSGRLLRIGEGRVLTQSLRKPYALTQSADGSRSTSSKAATSGARAARSRALLATVLSCGCGWFQPDLVRKPAVAGGSGSWWSDGVGVMPADAAGGQPRCQTGAAWLRTTLFRRSRGRQALASEPLAPTP